MIINISWQKKTEHRRMDEEVPTCRLCWHVLYKCRK